MISDPTDTYMFEIFEPVQLSTLKEMFNRGLTTMLKLTQDGKDGFSTDSSMEDMNLNQYDVYDKTI